MPHSLNCNYYCDCRWKPVFCQNGCDIGWGPQPLSLLTSTEAFAASSSLALSTRPRDCCIMQRSGTSAPQASEAPPAAAPGGFWAPGPTLSPDVHGRALRQEKGDDRRAVEPGCCPRAARPRRASQDLGEESVEAAPVAAQVAPHRRQVAVCAAASAWCRRLGAGRNAAEMKFLSSFDLYVLSFLSPSLLLMEIILNKLETELIELL